eukprot:6173294-Pleurochrysis_carterae.AAC.1
MVETAAVMSKSQANSVCLPLGAATSNSTVLDEAIDVQIKRPLSLILAVLSGHTCCLHQTDCWQARPPWPPC